MEKATNRERRITLSPGGLAQVAEASILLLARAETMREKPKATDRIQSALLCQLTFCLLTLVCGLRRCIVDPRAVVVCCQLSEKLGSLEAWKLAVKVK